MSYFDMLPTELKDNIFLSLGFKDIINTREYQSETVIQATKCFRMKYHFMNTDNRKWLQSKGLRLNDYWNSVSYDGYYLEIYRYMMEGEYKNGAFIKNNKWHRNAVKRGKVENNKWLIDGMKKELKTIKENLSKDE